MDRDTIIQTPRDAEAVLRARGVKPAALFGSVARGECGPDSDIDILVELDAKAVRTIDHDVGSSIVASICWVVESTLLIARA